MFRLPLQLLWTLDLSLLGAMAGMEGRRFTQPMKYFLNDAWSALCMQAACYYLASDYWRGVGRGLVSGDGGKHCRWHSPLFGGEPPGDERRSGGLSLSFRLLGLFRESCWFQNMLVKALKLVMPGDPESTKVGIGGFGQHPPWAGLLSLGC